MANLIILYWRDIPAQVIAERGRGRKREQAKIELPRHQWQPRNAAAMLDGVDATDDYLSEWRRAKPEECGEDLEAEAALRAAALGDEYTSEILRALVENGGKSTASRKD